MIHLIYIYFILNSFLVGRYLGVWYKYDNRFEAIGCCLCLFIFGAILSFVVHPLIWAFSREKRL